MNSHELLFCKMYHCLALKNLDSKTQGYVKKNDINKAKATLQLHDSRLFKTSNC